MTEAWCVGIDGGGTKTAAAAARVQDSGNERTGTAGACNIAAMGVDDALSSITQAVSTIDLQPHSIYSLFVAIAGYSAVEKRDTLASALSSHFANAVVQLAPDYIAAHASAFENGVGVTVIAGTGSIGYGVNIQGETAVCGGYGYVIDDAGTGYGLGREVLVAATRVFDGTAESSPTVELFQQTTGITTREQLIGCVYDGALDRVSIAALAPLVSVAAEAGDATAKALLMHAGGALARVAQATTTRLFGNSEPVQIAKVGSLWSVHGELEGVFERSVLRSHPLAQFFTPTNPPVVGALRLARQFLNFSK